MTANRSLIVMIALLGVFATLPTAEATRERGELIEPKSGAWLAWTSVEDVLEHRPERINTLLEALDLEREGLKKVKAALERGDKTAACHALLAYFEGPGREPWVVDRLGEPSDAHVERAQLPLNNRVRTHGSVVGEVPVRHGA